MSDTIATIDGGLLLGLLVAVFSGILGFLWKEIFRVRGFRHEDRKTLVEFGNEITLLKFQVEDLMSEAVVLNSLLQAHLKLDDDTMQALNTDAKIKIMTKVRRAEKTKPPPEAFE